MKFSEKLAKLRKNKNLSQEQLAEKLDISRQAVSKWESGVSYPDMNKMLSICKVLDCTLDELMDDGALGDNVSKEKSKVDIGEYLKDFLAYITRIYNMFYSMKFMDKVKCFLEMFFLAVILFIIGFIIVQVIDIFGFRILNIVFHYHYVNLIMNFIINLFSIALFLLGVIILFHIFKIRYLDYYVTIVDSNVTEKQIEESIDKNDKKTIIIRDPKHSSNKFFELLYKCFVSIIKFFCILMGFFVIFVFVCASAVMIVSLYHGIRYNIIFIFIALAILGFLACLYLIIEMIYRFIFNLAQNFRKLFYIGIVGISVLGVGLGASFMKFLDINVVREEVKEVVDVFEFDDINENTKIFYASNLIHYVEDDSIEGIKMEVKHSDKYTLSAERLMDDIYFDIFYNNDGVYPFDEYIKIVNDLKNNKYVINEYDGQFDIRVYGNKEIIEYLVKNDN